MIARLECARCGAGHDPHRLQGLCTACDGPLLARYDLAAVGSRWRRDDLGDRRDLWRWRPVLPLTPGERPLSLGEGGTPLLESRRIGPAAGLHRLAFKDETGNPGLSFKARGLAVAVHRARALGAPAIALSSAGYAGLAAAVYAAAAGLPCTVAMPADTPPLIVAACRAHGGRVTLADGSIAEAGRWIRERSADSGWFDLSTLREPYRLEGKKTLGYELAESHTWTLPDAIVYPTGGGMGLIGMWKAFAELEELGWIDGRRPKMVVVQAAGCAPLVAAHAAGATSAGPARAGRTAAGGLRVPSALGDFLILRAIRESGGTAVAVTEEALLDGARRLAREEGIRGGPEAGAAVAALPLLVEAGVILPQDRVVCFVTGHGLPYERLPAAEEPLSRRRDLAGRRA